MINFFHLEAHCGLKFLKFLGQCHSASEEVRTSLFNQFDLVETRFTESLQLALPNLEPDEVKRRMEFTLGAMSHTMILFEFTAANETDQTTSKQLFESLMSLHLVLNIHCHQKTLFSLMKQKTRLYNLPRDS